MRKKGELVHSDPVQKALAAKVFKAVGVAVPPAFARSPGSTRPPGQKHRFVLPKKMGAYYAINIT